MVRIADAALAVAITALVSAPAAGAWPVPFTPDQKDYIDSAREAGVEGSDDRIFNLALKACGYIKSDVDRTVIIGSLMMAGNIPREQAGTIVDLANEQGLCDKVGRQRYTPPNRR